MLGSPVQQRTLNIQLPLLYVIKVKQFSRMETMQELHSFAKDRLSQVSKRPMLKVYLVGAVVAVLGTVLGLLETISQPFSSGDTLDEDLVWPTLQEKRAVEDQRQSQEEAEVLKTEPKKLEMRGESGKRSSANRLHAS
ncbi:G0/G1 switch protein 2 [Arapaima gigas]